MTYDLSSTNEAENFMYKVKYFLDNKKTVELKKLSMSRSSQQNRALHQYFNFISTELNELGLEFRYFGVKGVQLSTRYNARIVKDYFWRPIQQALFDIESTTKINTEQINQIIDVITKFFADKGVLIEFPSINS